MAAIFSTRSDGITKNVPTGSPCRLPPWNCPLFARQSATTACQSLSLGKRNDLAML